MTEPWRRTQDVDEAALGDVLLVHDPRSGLLHALNTGAALVWASLDEPGTSTDVVDRIVSATGLTAPALADEVRVGLHALADQHLLAAGRADQAEPTTPPRVDATPVAGVTPDHGPARGNTRLGPLDALGTLVTIDVPDDHAVRPVLDALVHGLHADPGVSKGTVARRYALIPGDSDRLRLEVDGSQVRGDAPTSRQLAHLLWHLNHTAIADSAHRLVLHAGAVSGPSASVALAGLPDAGKSTLTAALVQRGLGYVTDEALAVDATGALTRYAKPLSLDDDACRRLGIDPNEARAGHLAPTDLGSIAGSPPDLVAVILPDLTRPFHATDLQVALEPVEAALALAPCTFGLAQRRQAGLDALVELVELVPVFALGTADLSVAVEAVRAMVTD